MDAALKRKIILRDLVLAFFNEEEGRSVHEMKIDPRFSAYKDG